MLALVTTVLAFICGCEGVPLQTHVQQLHQMSEAGKKVTFIILGKTTPDNIEYPIDAGAFDELNKNVLMSDLMLAMNNDTAITHQQKLRAGTALLGSFFKIEYQDNSVIILDTLDAPDVRIEDGMKITLMPINSYEFGTQEEYDHTLENMLKRTVAKWKSTHRSKIYADDIGKSDFVAVLVKHVEAYKEVNTEEERTADEIAEKIYESGIHNTEKSFTLQSGAGAFFHGCPHPGLEDKAFFLNDLDAWAVQMEHKLKLGPEVREAGYIETEAFDPLGFPEKEKPEMEPLLGFFKALDGHREQIGSTGVYTTDCALTAWWKWYLLWKQGDARKKDSYLQKHKQDLEDLHCLIEKCKLNKVLLVPFSEYTEWTEIQEETDRGDLLPISRVDEL